MGWGTLLAYSRRAHLTDTNLGVVPPNETRSRHRMFISSIYQTTRILTVNKPIVCMSSCSSRRQSQSRVGRRSAAQTWNAESTSSSSQPSGPERSTIVTPTTFFTDCVVVWINVPMSRAEKCVHLLRLCSHALMASCRVWRTLLRVCLMQTSTRLWRSKEFERFAKLQKNSTKTQSI